jgi:hypothetical protein
VVRPASLLSPRGFVGVVNAETGTTEIYSVPSPIHSRALGRAVRPTDSERGRHPRRCAGFARVSGRPAQRAGRPDRGEPSHLIATDTGDDHWFPARHPPPSGGRLGTPGGSRWSTRRTGRLDLLIEGTWDGHADRLLETVPTRRWRRRDPTSSHDAGDDSPICSRCATR